MKIKLQITFIILALGTAVNAQTVTPSVSNILRYGNGERIYGVNINSPFKYFENVTDLRIGLPGSFTVGARFLYDNPPEIGPEFEGIKRRFVEYNDGTFYLRAGNSSALFGRGLALNLFEDRGLAYDTWLDGIKAGYRSDLLTASIIAGAVEFWDSVNIARVENYNIKGGNVEFYPTENLMIGASYIYSDGELPVNSVQPGSTAIHTKSEIPGIYFSLNFDDISFYADWSHKWTNVVESDESSKGWGLYSSISYSGPGFGATLDYKNYRYDIRDPYERFDNTRPTRMLPIQNPPIVQREHSFTLLTRAIHEVDFNDEVGFQLEVFYNINDNTTITFNSSVSSIHDSYALNPDGFTFSRNNRSGSFLPSLSKEFFPYYEVFAEVEHYLALTSAFRGGIALREKTFYNEFSQDKSSTVLRSIVVPLQLQYSFTNDYAVTIQAEQEWVKDKSVVIEDDYFNHLITLIGSFYSKLTLALRYEYTTNTTEPSGRKNWYAAEFGYRITPANVVTLTYGIERGGQICSNGVCRYILPFKGFRATLVTQI